jgi:hypothetical protein
MRPLYFGSETAWDSTAGDSIDVATGLPLDSINAMPIDSATGFHIDPTTGRIIERYEPRYPIPPEWKMPDGLVTAVIDRGTGKLFSADWCPKNAMFEEIFLPNTQPTELCDVHAPGLFGAPIRDLPQVLPDSEPDSIPRGEDPPDHRRR